MTDSHSPFSHHSLEELTRRALEHLKSLGYRPDSLRHFEHTWRRLRAYAHERGLPDALSEELVDQFLAHYGVPSTAAERRSHHRHLRRATCVLAEIAVHGAVSRRVVSPSRLPTPLREILMQYLGYCMSHLGTRPSTLRSRRQHPEAFLIHAQQHGANAAAAISASHISSFIRSRSHFASKTTALTITTLRSFLRVGFAQGWLPADLSADIPAIRVRPDAKIPSVWTNEQVDALLAAVDLASPLGKRDRVILLLACRLGMRAGDIRMLTLDAIHWSTARITFAQQKTGTTATVLF